MRKASGPGCRGARQIVAAGVGPVRREEVQGRSSIADRSRQKAHRRRSGPSTSIGSGQAPPPPGDAVNRDGKRGSDPSGDQRLPVTFLCRDRQDRQPSTGISHEGTADDDRDHIKRLRLPAAYPVPGGGGFSAVPGRPKEAGIDDGDEVRERVDRRHGRGACLRRYTAAASPRFGVWAASRSTVHLSLPPENWLEHG